MYNDKLDDGRITWESLKYSKICIIGWGSNDYTPWSSRGWLLPIVSESGKFGNVIGGTIINVI